MGSMRMIKRNCQKMFFAFFFVVIFCLFQTAEIFSYPWHASCQLEWTLPESCETVKTKLIEQMNLWEGDSNCGQVSETCPSLPCGQNCLYKLVSSEQNTLKGTHTTPVKRYVDNMTFEFETIGAKCNVKGFSSSSLWYAILDMGTNYCNLRNLLDGTGLSSNEGFPEETENAICTQYESRNCARF